jgi:hypothetical protein
MSLLTKKWKKRGLALSTLVLFFLLGEMGFSTYYYHKHCDECSKYSLAWEQLIEVTKNKFSTKKEDFFTPSKEKQQIQRPNLKTADIDYDFKTRLSESHFKSYHEFATHACIPCHYGENGTNLVKPIEMMTESHLKNYLDASLNHGKMPPDEIFRKILLGKLNFLKKHLETDD